MSLILRCEEPKCVPSKAIGFAALKTFNLTRSYLDSIACKTAQPPVPFAARNVGQEACGSTLVNNATPWVGNLTPAGPPIYTTPSFTTSCKRGVVMVLATYGSLVDGAIAENPNIVPSATHTFGGAVGDFTILRKGLLNNENGRVYVMMTAPINQDNVAGTVAVKLTHPTGQALNGAMVVQVNEYCGVDPTNPIKQFATVPVFTPAMEADYTLLAPFTGVAWRRYTNLATFAAVPTAPVLMLAISNHSWHSTDHPTHDPDAGRVRSACNYFQDNGLSWASEPTAANPPTRTQYTNGGRYNDCNGSIHTAVLPTGDATIDFTRIQNAGPTLTQAIRDGHANKINISDMFVEVNADPGITATTCTDNEPPGGVARTAGSVVVPTDPCNATLSHMADIDARGGDITMGLMPGSEIEITRFLGTRVIGGVRYKNQGSAFETRRFAPIVGNDIQSPVAGTVQLETHYTVKVWSMQPDGGANEVQFLNIENFDVSGVVMNT